MDRHRVDGPADLLIDSGWMGRVLDLLSVVTASLSPGWMGPVWVRRTLFARLTSSLE